MGRQAACWWFFNYDSYIFLPILIYLCLDWIAHLRSWNMLEIVGVSFLCLMSWSDLDGFVERAGQQLWVCGSYTFKHFEPSIYSIYPLLYSKEIQSPHMDKSQFPLVDSNVSSNYHLRSLHLEICMPYIPIVSCNRSRFSCVSGSVWLHSYTAGKVRCSCWGPSGFAGSLANGWTGKKMNEDAYPQVDTWACLKMWYNMVLYNMV